MKNIDNLSSAEFEELIYRQIPMVKEMGIKVNVFEDNEIEVEAPLAKNKNHKSTAFGGSINSLMTLCAWAMAFRIIKKVDKDAHVVIQKSSIEYLLPIKSDFAAVCKCTDKAKAEKMVNTYRKSGKARIELEVEIMIDGQIAASFRGVYVVFKNKTELSKSE